MTRHQPRSRPPVDSVERALDEVGDRWTFLVLREAFFGVKRFDAFQTSTGASPAVLTDRITKLVANGIFAKSTYSAHPNRFEYRLTEKGRDLYPMIVLMMQWGDKWASDDKPPITLTHECGSPNPFTLTCTECDEPVTAETTDWSSTAPS